ncbi:hypothetical protein BJX64DRAFT_299320 [Aspergillus heterothallicus]
MTVAESNMTNGKTMTHNTNFANFEFPLIESAKVGPASLNIKARVRGPTIRFSLDSPKNVVVQVNDNIWDVLHILTSSPDSDIPSPSDPDLLIPSGKTVSIASRAMVKGPLIFRNVTASEFRGRGIPQSANIQTQSSSNIQISYTLLLRSNIGTHMPSDMTIHDLSLLFSGQLERDYGDSKGLTIQNAQHYAHLINIGTRGNRPSPETTDGVCIRNIDVVDEREAQQWYQSALAMNTGERNLIRNMLVDGMRVEKFRAGQLINMRVMNNNKYKTSPWRGIENNYIKDRSYRRDLARTALVLGFNLVVNGRVISDDMAKPSWYYTVDIVRMYVKEHVRKLRFIKST